VSARRLEGLGIVITRPREPAEALARALEREGARAIVFPALAIEEVKPSASTEEALAGLGHASLAILVSAHGLPQHFIDDGDPYCAHIKTCMDLILAQLPPYPSVLAYQSRVGPVPWIGPSTDEMITRLAKEGVRDVLVIPISFVSDHVETLYEIDLLYGEQAKKLGFRTFARAESLNDDPLFLDALADVVEPRLRR